MEIDTKPLERERIKRGWSKARLAKHLKLDPSVIGRVERGENRAPDTVKRIADFLGVPMEEIVIDDAAVGE